LEPLDGALDLVGASLGSFAVLLDDSSGVSSCSRLFLAGSVISDPFSARSSASGVVFCHPSGVLVFLATDTSCFGIFDYILAGSSSSLPIHTNSGRFRSILYQCTLMSARSSWYKADSCRFRPIYGWFLICSASSWLDLLFIWGVCVISVVISWYFGV
jgi:hypothetical protein